RPPISSARSARLARRGRRRRMARQSCGLCSSVSPSRPPGVARTHKARSSPTRGENSKKSGSTSSFATTLPNPSVKTTTPSRWSGEAREARKGRRPTARAIQPRSCPARRNRCSPTPSCPRFALYCKAPGALGRCRDLSYPSIVRWVIGIAGIAAIGGLGACALVSGLSDYSGDKGSADASVIKREPDARPTVEAGETEDGGAGGDDTGVSSADGGGTTTTAAGFSPALDTTENCGACGLACDLVNSIDAACTDTGCTYTGCSADWLDCDQTPPNAKGCESSITSITSCGACGNVWDGEHRLGAACGAT